MKYRMLKRGALVAMVAACLCLAGCYVPPDEISDNTQNMTIGSNNLPFQTLPPQVTVTPTPTPTARPQQGQENQQGQQGGNTIIQPQNTPNINWDENWGSTATATPGNVPNYNGQGGAITVVTQKPTNTPKPATPTPTSNSLKVGSSGAAVRELQQRLKDLGYYTGTVDGDFGTGTENAVRAFQKANGLTQDGKAGKQTLTKLYSNNAVPYSASQQGQQNQQQNQQNQQQNQNRVTPTPRPTATPNLTNARYLTVGYSGNDVKRLQQRLIDLGYLGGKANGDFGAATKAAVVAFQGRMGLWDDGIAGPDTQAKLYSNSAKKASSMAAYTGESLKQGMNGDGVRALQKQLKKLGYYNGTVDGDYGSGTVTAVMAFQQNNGLKADGIAGNATLNKLYADDAVKANGTIGNINNNGNVIQSSGGTNASGVGSSQLNQSGSNNGGMSGTGGITGQVSSTGYYTLQEGDKSEGVRKLQEALKRLGYYTGKVDGSYGPGTTSAVMAFQRMNNLTVDGKAGPATQRALYGTNTDLTYSTLREGDEGPAVLNLQYTLYELGYYDGEMNGVYGATTRDAVRAFQIANHLTPVDGVAGNKTLQKLYSSKAVPAQAENDTYVTLRKGDRGDDVVQLQDVLCQLGYLKEVTGEYDNATVAAVRTFQQYNGLAVDGVAGATTQQKLYNNPVPFPSW